MVGIVVGLAGAIVFSVAVSFRLPLLLAAVLAVAVTTVMTGALHEDGLADVADGLRRRRDARAQARNHARQPDRHITASARSFYPSCCASFAIVELGDNAAVLPALIAAHAGSRACIPAFMQIVQPARADGLSADVGAPSSAVSLAAALIGAVVLMACLGIKAGLVALLLLTGAGAFLAWLCWQQIRGQTGDVLGALEQAGEMIVLLVAAAVIAIPPLGFRSR